MICPKCDSTINSPAPEVLEFHDAMCARWAAKRSAMRTHEFRQYCTGCDASCHGYALDSGWEEERCVFCGSHMDGFRIINSRELK